jgi:prophage regulatory protein
MMQAILDDQAADDTPRFLSDKALASRWQVSRSAVRKWQRLGRIPQPVKLGGGSTRWPLERILQYEAVVLGEDGAKPDDAWAGTEAEAIANAERAERGEP